MIARVWKGWTTRENADAYEDLLRTKVLPDIRLLEGHRGAYILRENRATEAEFVVINFFENLEAVKAFAGEDYEVPVFEPEARQLLAKVEPLAHHYEVKASPAAL